jgi:sugar phosphate isomerase/epimerase
VGNELKIAISNIAWPIEDESDVAHLMMELGVAGVEIAPTKVWEKPLDATSSEIDRYRTFWNERGIEIVALQALLFGQPQLTVFENDGARSATLEYLAGFMRLASKLGARALVFGSPKNRKVGALAPDRAREIALAFFQAVGRAAAAEGVVFCVEPNPEEYQCDFITTSAEGLELVRTIDHAGFGLHLDAAAMKLAGEDPESSLIQCEGSLQHFHISEPYLRPIDRGGVDHPRIAAVLRQIEYRHWTSIEMRHNEEAPTLEELRRVLEYAKSVYGGET